MAVLMAEGLSAADVGPRLRQADPFLRFWAQFRKSVAAEDLPKFVQLVGFPFVTPQGAVSKRDMEEVFPQMIEEGGLKALVAQKPLPNDADWKKIKKGTFELGSFYFSKDSGSWLLIRWGEEMTEEEEPEPVVVAPVAKAPPPKPTPPPVAAPSPVVKPTPPVVTKTPAPVVPAPAPTPPAEDAEPADEFLTFWTEFRTAALYRDLDNLKALTKFPFFVKGSLEENAAHRCSAREFDAYYAQLMEANPGISPVRETMRELISRLETPPESVLDRSVPGEVRLGIFVFQKSRNGWRFVRAYLGR